VKHSVSIVCGFDAINIVLVLTTALYSPNNIVLIQAQDDLSHVKSNRKKKAELECKLETKFYII